MTKGKKRRYPISRFDPEASADFAFGLLRELKLDGAVIGTVNTWTYLSSDEQMQTKDLDLAVRQEDIVWIEKALRDKRIQFSQLDIGGVKVEMEKGIHVDFVDRHTEPDIAKLFREALEATDESVVIGDLEVPAVPIEYVIAMKLATARPKDDLIITALLQQEGVDVDRAVEIVRRHFGVAGVNRLKALARR